MLKRIVHIAASVLVIAALFTSAANAETIFTESFEKPVVTNKGDTTPAGWQGGKKCAVLNKDTGHRITNTGQ